MRAHAGHLQQNMMSNAMSFAHQRVLLESIRSRVVYLALRGNTGECDTGCPFGRLDKTTSYLQP